MFEWCKVFIFMDNTLKPVATSYSFVAWDRSHDVFHKNKLPYICSMYDTGFKVLSMKIKYFAPFKHKYQSLAHEN
jgi:hypothetical protein